MERLFGRGIAPGATLVEPTMVRALSPDAGEVGGGPTMLSSTVRRRRWFTLPGAVLLTFALVVRRQPWRGARRRRSRQGPTSTSPTLRLPAGPRWPYTPRRTAR